MEVDSSLGFIVELLVGLDGNDLLKDFGMVWVVLGSGFGRGTGSGKTLGWSFCGELGGSGLVEMGLEITL